MCDNPQKPHPKWQRLLKQKRQQQYQRKKYGGKDLNNGMTRLPTSSAAISVILMVAVGGLLAVMMRQARPAGAK